MAELQPTHEDQRLLTLVGCIRGIVLELDGDARYLNAWADDPALLAGSREEVIGKTIDQVFGPDVGPPFTAVVKQVYGTGETVQLEYPLSLGGQTRWFFADVKRVAAEAGFTVVLFGRDITERKAAEEALRVSEERFRLAARASNDAFYDWEILSGNVKWSESAKTVFGEDNIESPQAFWFGRLHPDDLERTRLAHQHGLGSGEASWSIRYRLRWADGSYRDILDRGFIVREDGKPIRVVGSMADVTEINRLQAQLVQAERLSAIGMLAAGVGHEINNPLQFVLGNIDYALTSGVLEASNGLAGEDIDDVRTALRDAHVGARRIAEIVKALKLFSRSEPLVQNDVMVENVVEMSIKMAQNEIRHRATLVRKAASTAPVNVSESQLGQVCLNLLVNAAQAFPATRREHQEIEVATGVDARGWVFISVADNGPGIATEHVGRIFDPFFTTKPLGAGTGIGLSVCLGIVQAMGGELTVTSSPNVRTAFTVKLPPARVAARPVVVVKPAAARVLVIDDDAGVARSLERMLKTEFSVRTVTSGEAALVALSTDAKFDVVLCDLMMPEMTGMELFDVVRERYPALSDRFLFMTGGAFTAEVGAFMRSLTTPAVQKPIAATDLQAKIAELIQAVT